MSTKRKATTDQLKTNSPSKPNVETVTFVNPDKIKSPFYNPHKRPRREFQKPDLDLKKTRYEVMKFAAARSSGTSSSGFTAEEQIAIQLGARKPKKAYVNYKVILEQKKKEKLLKLDEDVKPKSIKKSNSKRKSRK